MKASDAIKPVVAAVAAMCIFLSPFIYTVLTKNHQKVLRPEKPVLLKNCVLPADRMRREHMSLLYRWRDEVVRKADRTPVLVAGISYEKSLTAACMKCHASKERFCDRCHTNLAVAPLCWECHIAPKEQNK
jgi:hypothetical protein